MIKSIADRIETAQIMRNAARKAAKRQAEKAERDHLNRPHVQSVHMVGYWTPQPAPTVREQGVTPRYVLGLALLAFAVFYINTSPEAATKLGCYQVASK